MEARVLEHDQAGEGDPPLVLVPGGLTGWDSVLPLVPALAAHRRVLRVQPVCNAEGFAGRVGDPAYEARVERESLERTLDSLGVEEIHLVGWSNGARIALDFALAHPDRVRTLTGIEPAAWWLLTDTDESARGFEAFIARMRGRELGDEDVCEFLVRAGLGDPDVDFQALPAWELWSSGRQSLSWSNVESAAAGIEGFDRLAHPTLLIRGRATSPWLHGVVDVLADGLPNATVLELDGGHACILENPDEFVSALMSHVGR